MPQPARGPKTFGAGGGHAKNAKYTLHRLGGYIWQYKYLFLLAIIVSLASNLFAMGLSCGNTVLTVAVMAILITAPLGAFGIDYTYKKLLK